MLKSSRFNKVKKLIIILLFFGLVISIPALFLQGGLSTENIKLFVTSFGIFAPLSFMAITALTNVIPPLAVTPFWIASIFLFGPVMGFVYSYAANLLGSSINYFIAKFWGRPAVAKIAGQKALQEIDKLPNITNPVTVFVLKFVGGAATDYISYASGLSRIGYIYYLFATAFSILPMMAIGYYLISRMTVGSAASVAGALGTFYLVNYLSTLLLAPASWLLLRKHPPKQIEEAIDKSIETVWNEKSGG